MTNTQSRISQQDTPDVHDLRESDVPNNTQTPALFSDVLPENTLVKECIICYESLNTHKNICITECGHEFCFSCMMKHVQRNNGCPICRSVIIEEIESEDDSGSEYDEDEDETIDEDEEASEEGYPIEQFVSAFEAKGYGLKDALSLLMDKFSKTDPKYTKEYINQLQEDIEDMNEELEEEDEEREQMEAEDTLSLRISKETDEGSFVGECPNTLIEK